VKGLAVFLSVLSLGLFLGLGAQASIDSDRVDRQTYSIRYLGIIPFAQASIEVKGSQLIEGREVVSLRAMGSLTPFLNKIINASFAASSLFDVGEQSPLEYQEKMIVKGEVKDEKRVEYDPLNNTMFLEGVKRRIPDRTQDPLSLLYFLRGQSFKEGEPFSWMVNSNQSTYVVEGQLFFASVDDFRASFDFKEVGHIRSLLPLLSTLCAKLFPRPFWGAHRGIQ